MKQRLYFESFLFLCSVFLLIFSYPCVNLEIGAWITFIPLFFLIRHKSRQKSFLIFYLAGIIFWSAHIYWLVNVSLWGLIVLVLYLALYFGAFGYISSACFRRNHLYFVLFVPAVWVLLEYLRSHLFTGFAWGLLGYTQYLNLPVIQISNITGVWGVSFLIIIVNVLVYKIIDERWFCLEFKRGGIHILFLVFILGVTLGYGFFSLKSSSNSDERNSIKVAVIQGNIAQSIKWEEYAKEGIFKKYLYLSREALKDNPDLIIWPEASLPGILQKDEYLWNRLKTFIYDTKTAFLVGAVTLEDDSYYNSAYLLLGNGELFQRYDKLHLVPFGEYIPVRQVFGFLEAVVPIGDFNRGREYTVFNLPQIYSNLSPKGNEELVLKKNDSAFSVLICFEDVFPEISRHFVKNGAGFLVNITNDAWFGMTSSPYQHLSASVFRAVENNVYLVRSANTGVSAFISPIGRIFSLSDNNRYREIFVDGYKTERVFIKVNKKTFYTSWGDWFITICGIIVMIPVFFTRNYTVKKSGTAIC